MHSETLDNKLLATDNITDRMVSLTYSNVTGPQPKTLGKTIVPSTGKCTTSAERDSTGIVFLHQQQLL